MLSRVDQGLQVLVCVVPIMNRLPYSIRSPMIERNQSGNGHLGSVCLRTYSDNKG